MGGIIFFFLALPLIGFLVSLSNNSWNDGGILAAKIGAVALCGVFSLKGLEFMGPYYDGEAVWEESPPWVDPPTEY